jgi:hypothetical protein
VRETHHAGHVCDPYYCGGNAGYRRLGSIGYPGVRTAVTAGEAADGRRRDAESSIGVTGACSAASAALDRNARERDGD